MLVRAIEIHEHQLSSPRHFKTKLGFSCPFYFLFPSRILLSGNVSMGIFLRWIPDWLTITVIRAGSDAAMYQMWKKFVFWASFQETVYFLWKSHNRGRQPRILSQNLLVLLVTPIKTAWTKTTTVPTQNYNDLLGFSTSWFLGRKML